MRPGLAAALLLAALLALAVAGCGPLPRPFQPDVKGDNALLQLPDSSGIAVPPLTGDAPRPEGAMAEAMAEALQKQNVPASVGSGNRASRWLLGDAQVVEMTPDSERLEITWELYGADSEPVGAHTQSVTLPAGVWLNGEPNALAGVARDAAPQIAAMIQERAARRSDLPGYPAGTRVVVQLVEGGPAEAASALSRAMAGRLRDRGLPLGDQPAEGDVIVQGRLSLGEAKNGRRPIEITWIVRRQGQDGTLGELNQANAVPVEQIERGWTRLADLIAQAAVPGVLQVLEAQAPSGG